MKHIFTLNKIKKLFIFSITTFFIVNFFSCTVGLGASVDVQPPVIEITSHSDNDSVAEKFSIKGTAYDNDRVTLITIDFEDADIHYQIIPGDVLQKKSAKTGDWTDIEEDENNYCKIEGKKLFWSVDVDVDNKADSKNDNTYSFTAIAYDKLNNSGKASKKECSLIVDTNSPDVSIYKPELFTGNRSDIETITSSYDIKNGNVLSRLLNGEIVISGRQDNTLNTKALRIELDNGALPSGKRKSTIDTKIPVKSMDEIFQLDDSKLGDVSEPKVYYSHTIEGQNLREWSVTIHPEDLAKPGNNLDSGKHLIRVITTSISAANTWERKVIGYFIWYPEADIPWITVSVGDSEDKPFDLKHECYPGANISGGAQDDDGIKTIISTIYKKSSEGEYVKYVKDNYENPKTHSLSALNAKYSAWSVAVPSESGEYKLELTVTDINNKSDSVTRYFKTSDVSAPVITIEKPSDNSNAIVNLTGDINFKGIVTDDGSIKNVLMVWLNPALKSNVDNKIKFLTGDSTAWNLGGETIRTDDNGNIIFRLDDGSGSSSCLINKTINLYDDLKIGTVDKNGKIMPLGMQEFIFLANDGTTNAIKTITLSGDTSAPHIEFVNISLNGKTESLVNGNLPAFPKIKNGDQATITGKWSDNFNDNFVNKNKIYNIELTWGTGNSKQSASAVCTSDGKWSCKIPAPATGGTITARLKDFGGNEKVIQSAASIESDDLGLARIGCENDDGAYKEGSHIVITLEFNKTTAVEVNERKPELKLNNGKIARYIDDGSSSVSHKFEYIVEAGDLYTEKLSVVAINNYDAKWYDGAITGERENLTSKVNILNLPNGTNLENTRTITIDTVKPRINSIKPLTSAGAYKQGSVILFMMDFSEDVKIIEPSGLSVAFGNSVSTTSASVSGTKNVLFTYKIEAAQDINNLSFNSVVHSSNVIITDKAGNELNNWTPLLTPDFSGIVVDNTKPAAPKIYDGNNQSVLWMPEKVIYSQEGTSFIIKGESGASIEYSLDGGENWIPYVEGSKISIVNNGTYNVCAQQIDKAGNISEFNPLEIKTFTLDKGELLTRITAETPSGTYSTKTAVNSITGRIEFRKAVTIGKGATVTLNAFKANGTPYVCPINECISQNSVNSVFTFTYTITEGDYIQSADKKLDVTSWNLGQVDIGENIKVTVDLPLSGKNKRLNENRDIKIVTGKPGIITGGITMTGIGKDAVLRITFDRAVSKVSGDIVFEYNDVSSNEFHVPTILSKEEYDELQSIVDISSYYKPGMSGASKENSVLVNDTSTKYILDFDYSDTKSEVVQLFKDANKHKMTVPVISDQVTIENNNGINCVLTVRFGENYKLPVNGAAYKISIPEAVVIDDVMNTNDARNDVVVSRGVEQPQIRLLKPSYEIENAGDTKQAYADMSKAQTAKMKIDCRTPGAQIKYGTSVLESDEVVVNRSIWEFNTKTADASIPTNLNTPYTANASINLGSDKVVNSYSDANGLKIAIGATASKDNYTSLPVYEYANRTVLKFIIANSSTYIEFNAGNANTTENLTCKELKMWIIGGDAEYGTNTLDPFPLSWQDPSNFKLMAGNHYTDTVDGNLSGEWWWVTWDVYTKTYHGFVIGDVPEDAATNGPKTWYAGECAWAATKMNYILLPGETLVMALNNSSGVTNPYHSRYLFNLKNKGSR